MFDNLQITIPSRSRANDQKTIFNLGEDLWPHIIIIVPIEQYLTYRSAVPKDITVLDCPGYGIAAQRDFILMLRNSGKVIMLDDDLKFYKRTEEGSRFPGALRSDSVGMIWDIYQAMDNYAMVGI